MADYNGPLEGEGSVFEGGLVPAKKKKSPYNPYNSDNTGSSGYSDILSGLGVDVNRTAPAPSTADSVSKFVGAAFPVVGAVGSIIDTITNIYAASKYSKEAEKNRVLAERVYNQQRTDEQAQQAFTRGITERGMALQEGAQKFNQGEAKLNRKEATRQDNYTKYLTFLGSYNNFINAEPNIRKGYLDQLRANAGMR